MKSILIFSGTTEGRELAETIAKAGIFCEVCVATEYGEQIMEPGENRIVHQGRMDEAKMLERMREQEFAAVVDATHPYATQASENIKKSAAKAGLPLLRLKRNTKAGASEEANQGNVHYVESHAACAAMLEQKSGNVLLTTGSKELACYTKNKELQKRLFVRVLPGVESIRLCQEHGIYGRQIIAMQGPFIEELNEALIRQYQIAVLVTKESGETGGFSEKLKAAKAAGIPVIVIGNPDVTEGFTRGEVLKQLSFITGVSFCRMQICLAGIGMGNPDLLTVEVQKAIESADYLFGAKRLLDAVWAELNPKAKREPYYLAKDVLPFLKRISCEGGGKAVILFSGDTGFFSGAEKMYQSLLQEKEAGTLQGADIRIYPGISAISYLAARTGKSWQDAKTISIHGRQANLLKAVRTGKKVFLLVSGLEDMRQIGVLFIQHKLEHVRITAGYRLSYPEEKIMTLSPEECAGLTEEGLYTCLIEHDSAQAQSVTPGLPDHTFLRDEVPMTKEEVREISLCKLRLHENAVIYDIGSGTGSIAVEAAGLSDSISVYAIEKKELALSLIQENCKKFGLCNVHITAGEAPDILNALPVPTHAFIGGSSGNLVQILEVLYRKNQNMRVVMNIISLETLAEVTAYLKDFKVSQEEVVQVQVSRAKKAGKYHLMQAENPIYIVSFSFHE